MRVSDYVRVVKGFGQPLVVELVVQHQSFRLFPECDEQEEATFLAEQLVVALERMVEQVCSIPVIGSTSTTYTAEEIERQMAGVRNARLEGDDAEKG